MKCVVLAAGYATRLYPITKRFPKPLLEVKGKTILDWLVDDIDSRCAADEFIIVSNSVYRGEFENWAEKKSLKALISVLDDGSVTNETRLGAVKDMLFAINERDVDCDCLVIAGDNVLDFSLSRLVEYADNKPGSCAMRYFEPDETRLKRAGVVEIGEDDRMLRMVEKPNVPASNWCVPPFYFYKREDIPLLKTAVENGCATDAPGSALAWLGSITDVYMMRMPGKRYDIGTIETYKQVCGTYAGINPARERADG